MAQRAKLVEEFIETTGRMYRCMMPMKHRFLDELQLNRPQLETLSFIARLHAPTIKDISQALNTTSSAATQIVEGLVAEKLVTRKESSEDRRIVQVMITKAGQQKLARFKQLMIKQMEKRLTPLTDEELTFATTIAKKFITTPDLT